MCTMRESKCPRKVAGDESKRVRGKIDACAELGAWRSGFVSSCWLIREVTAASEYGIGRLAFHWEAPLEGW